MRNIVYRSISIPQQQIGQDFALVAASSTKSLQPNQNLPGKKSNSKRALPPKNTINKCRVCGVIFDSCQDKVLERKNKKKSLDRMRL